MAEVLGRDLSICNCNPAIDLPGLPVPLLPLHIKRHLKRPGLDPSGLDPRGQLRQVNGSRDERRIDTELFPQTHGSFPGQAHRRNRQLDPIRREQRVARKIPFDLERRRGAHRLSHHAGHCQLRVLEFHYRFELWRAREPGERHRGSDRSLQGRRRDGPFGQHAHEMGSLRPQLHRESPERALCARRDDTLDLELALPYPSSHLVKFHAFRGDKDATFQPRDPLGHHGGPKAHIPRDKLSADEAESIGVVQRARDSIGQQRVPLNLSQPRQDVRQWLRWDDPGEGRDQISRRHVSCQLQVHHRTRLRQGHRGRSSADPHVAIEAREIRQPEAVGLDNDGSRHILRQCPISTDERMALMHPEFTCH